MRGCVCDLSVSTFPGQFALPIVAETMGFKDCPQVALRHALRKMFCCSSNPHFQCVVLLVVEAVLEGLGWAKTVTKINADLLL
jgi:hypothetical protein